MQAFSKNNDLTINTEKLRQDLNHARIQNACMANLCRLSESLIYSDSAARMSADTLFNAITNHVKDLFALDACYFFLESDDRQHLCSVAQSDDIPERYIPLVPENLRLSDTTNVVSVCASSNKLANYNPEHRRPNCDPWAEAELVLPIKRSNRHSAVLYCIHHDPDHFAPYDLVMFNSVISIVVACLHHYDVNQESQQSLKRLEKSEKLQRSLFNIASLTAESVNMDGIYAKLHHSIASIINADNFFIAIYDKQSESIHFPYIVDHKTPISPSEHYPAEVLENSLSGWVIKHDKPLFLQSREEIVELLSQGDCQMVGEIAESWLGVPFYATNNFRGVVVVQTYKKEETYTHADRELMVFVSQQIGIALGRVLAEQKLQHQATHDSLTNLPNRLLFNDRLNHAFERMKRRPAELIALLYLDLDHFKNINDEYGHIFGDTFLISASNVIGDCIRESDTLARLGGDEFAILLEGISGEDEVFVICKRIIDSFKKPITVEGQQIVTSTSVGVAFPDNRTFAVEELIAHADDAMYQAKKLGRGNFQVFQSLENSEPELINLEDELSSAISEHQLALQFEPIIRLADQQLLAFESVVRWQHPLHGSIYPSEFFDVAADAGLMLDIDKWVFENAIKSSEFQDNLAQLHINLSSQFISWSGALAFLVNEISQLEIAAERINIEISERLLKQDDQSVYTFIKKAKSKGFGIYLDDFGSSFSSLSYLQELDLTGIKLDKSLVTDVHLRRSSSAVIKAIASLAVTMQIKIVAKSVENEQQVEKLTELGVESGQGYYLLCQYQQANAAD